MGEPISTVGDLAGICGHDGTDWIKVKTDSDGKLQIEVDTSVLPSGAATAANQITMITALQLIDDLRNALDSVGTDELDVNVESSVLPSGAATDTVVQAIRDRLGALTNPAAGSTNKLLADALTALQKIDDLQGALDSVDTDELVVNVDESALPAGAATEATLAELSLRVGDEITPGAGAVNYRLAELLTELETKLETADFATDTDRCIKAFTHGYVSSTWQKQPLQFGYSDVYGEYFREDNVAAGSHDLTFGTVPAGEIWVVTNYIAYCTTSNPSTISLVAYVGGTSMTVDVDASPTAYVPLKLTGRLYLKEDDYLLARFFGCALNDDIIASAAGYKMDIDL